MTHYRHGAWSRASAGRRRGFLALGLALAIGLVLAAWIVAGSLERIKLAGDKIVVKGYAEEKVVSDAGSWRAIVSVRGPDLETAFRGLQADSARLVKLVAIRRRRQGETGSRASVNTQTIFEFGPGGVQTGRITGYELNRTFEVTSADVALIGRIANRSGSV